LIKKPDNPNFSYEVLHRLSDEIDLAFHLGFVEELIKILHRT
jgi:hypothetical protein